MHRTEEPNVFLVLPSTENNEMEYPVFDEINFLKEEQLAELESYVPLIGCWNPSVVFSKKNWENVTDPSIRSSLKVKEERRQVKRAVEKMLVKNLLPLFRQDPRFRYIAFRLNHTEWLRYTKDMFFKKHKDFERFICTGMVPYVCLLGMNDTLSGGETKVGDRFLNGGKTKNGMACFPSNLVHEAMNVNEGLKLVLKVEMLVFFSEDPLVIQSPEKTYVSYWDKAGLGMVDSFVSGMSRFHPEETTKTVNEETARDLYKCMLNICDPHFTHIWRDFHQYFPDVSPVYVHDLLMLHHAFERRESGTVILGSCPRVWMELNQGIHPWVNGTDNFSCGVAMWERRYTPRLKEGYRFVSMTDRGGKKEDEFYSFEYLKEEMIEEYIDRHEIDVRHRRKSVSSAGHRGLFLSNFYKMPSSTQMTKIEIEDIKMGMSSVKGDQSVYDTEYCNDEDSGRGNEIEMKVYVSLEMQVRWWVFFH